MILGFDLLGAFAVGVQLVVIGGSYGNLRHRRPVEDGATRNRVVRVLVGSSGPVTVGQLAVAAIGSLWVSPLFTLEQRLPCRITPFLSLSSDTLAFS